MHFALFVLTILFNLRYNISIMSCVCLPSSWHLTYLLATYYFTFIYTTIIDSIIGGVTTRNIKERCLCPAVFNFLRVPFFSFWDFLQYIDLSNLIPFANYLCR